MKIYKRLEFLYTGAMIHTKWNIYARKLAYKKGSLINSSTLFLIGLKSNPSKYLCMLDIILSSLRNKHGSCKYTKIMFVALLINFV